MTSPDFRAFRATVLTGLAELERDTRAMVHEMSTAHRLTQYDADWGGDMADAAIALLVERGVFADDGEAVDAVAVRAGRLAESRKAEAARVVAS